MPIALSGSLVLSGSITVSGSISSTGGITISGSIASASYAATSSYANTFTVANTLTAQTLVVQTITSSIDFITGSARFGSNTGNTHQFTGSVLVSGSQTIDGNITTSRYYITPNSTNAIYNIVNSDATFAGSYIMQAGGGSSGFGGAIVAYGHAHASKPGWITAGISAASSGKFTVNTQGLGGGTDVFVVQQNGNVGIGTTTPSRLLEIRSGGTSTTPTVYFGGSPTVAVVGGETGIAFSSNIVAATGVPGATQTALGGVGFTYVSATSPTEFNIGISGTPTVASNIRFWNQTEVMRITSGGNVGIGTTSPYSRLDINGGNIRMGEILNSASSYIGKQYSANSNFYSSIQFYSTSGEDAIIFNSHLSGISSGERMRITGGGNLLVGTTSDTGWKFRVISSTDGAQITSSGSSQTLNLLNASANPTILRMSNNNGNFWDIQNNPSVNSLTFDYNDTTRFSINADGSLIIGRQLGNQYSMTSGGGTGTAIVDTGITYSTGDYGGYGRGTTYQVVLGGNPNAGGSGGYYSMFMGILVVYTGWSGSAVTTYIQYTQLMSGYNVGPLSITPVFWNGSSEVSSVGVYTTGYQIRLKIAGYNSSYTGQDQSVYLTRLS